MDGERAGPWSGQSSDHVYQLGSPPPFMGAARGTPKQLR